MMYLNFCSQCVEFNLIPSICTMCIKTTINVVTIICYLIIIYIFHSLNKYLLSVYYVTGTIETAQDIRENK